MANEEYPDTSYAQGTTDPNALATRKPPAWCIRAGYGSGTVDDQYRRNVGIARDLGIPVIHYWFCYPQVQGPEAQADAFNGVVGGLSPGDGLMADFEDDREWTWATIAGASGPVDWGARFLAACGPSDYPPLWYTYPAMLTSYGLGALRGRWPFVLGDGGAGYQLGQQIWQYTTRGSWPGFSGGVDINRVVVGNLTDYLYRATPVTPGGLSAKEATILGLDKQADVDGGKHKIFSGLYVGGTASGQERVWYLDVNCDTADGPGPVKWDFYLDGPDGNVAHYVGEATADKSSPVLSIGPGGNIDVPNGAEYYGILYNQGTQPVNVSLHSDF